jgi:type IV pilus assembly protein PilZ
VQEKRLHPRKPVEIPVIILFEATRAQATGTCRDISIGGMFVETDTKAAFGETVSVSIEAPGGALVFAAVVRWTAPTGLGLQFGQVGARETHAIVQWMSGKH